MNISGSLSIKTSTIGGKASGSYVDSDKFKSSDINFHLQVKVTNQMWVANHFFFILFIYIFYEKSTTLLTIFSHDAKNYNQFNKLEDLDDSRFAEVYGVSRTPALFSKDVH